MKKRLMVLAMAGIMVTGLVSSANIVSADDQEASGLEAKESVFVLCTKVMSGVQQ